MAWNEPGGNSNNQDPWGGKRRNNGDRKGPPDLDEAFRKLQESLNGLFGGGKKRGDAGGGSGKSGGFGGILGMILAVPLAGIIQVFVVKWASGKESRAKRTETGPPRDM